MIVTAETTDRELSDQYNKGIKDGFIDISLSNQLSESDLCDIAIIHKDQPYSEFLYEIISEHQNSTPRVLETIIKIIGNSMSNSLINSIITSGKASKKILNEFSDVPSNSVKEHLELAYLKTELDEKKDVDEYKNLLSKYLNDNDIRNQAKRFMIASHKNTPFEILEILSKDSHKHIADAANKSMTKGKMK